MRKFVLAILMLLILAACGIREPLEPERAEILPLDVHYALEAAHERRLGIEKPDYTVFYAMTQGRRPMTWDQLYEYGLVEGGEWGEADWPTHLPIEDAKADAREFFAAIRHFYGGYVYFGGDEVFKPMLEAILAEIAAYGESHDYNGQISSAALGNILHSHLQTAIFDNHFAIGGQRLGSFADFFQNAGLIFDRTPAGFRNRETGLYVTYVQNHEINELFRLAVNNAGELHYTPIVTLFDHDGIYEIHIKYEDGSEVTTRLHRLATVHSPWSPARLTFREGIPIVTVNTMGFTAHDNSMSVQCARNFLSFAEDLRDEPVIIVDLRTNGGGNGLMGKRWFYALLGEVIPTNFVSLQAREYTGPWEIDPENRFHDRREDVEQFWDMRAFEGHILSHAHDRRIVANDQLIIILTGRGTASAAEAMTDLAFNIENTLVIGQNTAGVLAFDLTYSAMHLPRSGVSFGFGRTMTLWPKSHFTEGAGLTPDIWAFGNPLLAALALAQDFLPPSIYEQNNYEQNEPPDN
jgi:predicted small lipoprotein YifL